MSQYEFFLFCRTFGIPRILIKNNLGDVQKTGVSSDMRPAFFHEFLKKMSRVCSPSEVEIKTADFYFLHKQRYNFHICLLIAFGVF